MDKVGKMYITYLGQIKLISPFLFCISFFFFLLNPTLELSVIDKIIKVLRHQECDDAFSHKDDAISCCRGHCKFAEDEKLWRLIQEYWEKDRNSTTTKLGRRSGTSMAIFGRLFLEFGYYSLREEITYFCR